MWAVLYNIQSIYTVPHRLSGCPKWSLGAQNLLRAITFDPTCKIQIKFPRLMMAWWLCHIAFGVSILCTPPQIALLAALRELKTS
jgi:hypothetical protein